MYIKPSVCRLRLGMIGGTSIASGGLVDVGRDPRPLSSGGEVNMAAVVISPISNSSRSRGRTLAMTGHGETHLQDVLAWRHRKAMQEQCSCPLMRKPCSWVLIYTYPLLNGFHEYAVPQANVAHHFSTSNSCFPRIRPPEHDFPNPSTSSGEQGGPRHNSTGRTTSQENDT